MATEADIRQELSNCADFTDAAGIIWRVSLIEMRIKYKTDATSSGWHLHKKYLDVRQMAGDWRQITKRHDDAWDQPIEDCEILPPENTLPPVQVDHTPDAVMSQWKRANAGLLEIVRFGAMLVEIDMSLKRQTHKGGCFQTGETLKAWLEQNCPDINYKTSMGYKVVAEQMRDKFKIPAKLPLTLALPRADGTIEVFIPDTVKIDKSRIEKYQREFYGMCEGKSMYQLTLDLGLRDPKPRGGDKKSGKDKPKLTEAQKLELQKEAAREYWNETLENMCWQVRKAKSHKLLNEAELTQALTRLRVVADALKDSGTNNK